MHTYGAKLVAHLEDHMNSDNEHFINSSEGDGLNDCHDTTLLEVPPSRSTPTLSLTHTHLFIQILEQAKKRVGEGGTLKIGVIGVWTELKVLFLLYDLKTRAGIKNLATCSALTAGGTPTYLLHFCVVGCCDSRDLCLGSRDMHFYALTHIKNILDVEVFDSVGEFAEWLSPHGIILSLSSLSLSLSLSLSADTNMSIFQAELTLPSPASYPCARVTMEDNNNVPLSEDDHALIWYPFPVPLPLFI